VKAIFTQKRLPEAWKSVPLGSVVDFIGGSQPPKETFRTEPYEGGVRLVQIRDFRTDKFPTYIPQSLARRHFEESDVMIGRYGPPVFQILRGLSGSYNVALMKAAPKPDLTKDYLFHLLQEPGLHHHVVANSERTAGQSGVNLTLLEAIEIPLPPLAEQRRIAEVLDRAEALRAKRRAALAELDSLTQSLFLDLFGDPVTNPKGFIISRMGDVCDVRDGTHDSPKYVSEGGYPLVTSKNLSGGFVDLSDVNLISEADYIQINKRSKVDRGDIIMPMIGTIGSPVLVDGEPRFAIKNVALIKFTEDSPSPVLVRHLLSCSYFDYIIGQKNRGGTQKFVSLGDLRALPLLVPPIALQQEFARRVGAVEKLKAAQRTALAEQDALFATLQHRAFRGEL
jgi:type I restriction enzyme, S subunit